MILHINSEGITPSEFSLFESLCVMAIQVADVYRPIFHQSQQVFRGISIMLLDILINLAQGRCGILYDRCDLMHKIKIKFLWVIHQIWQMSKSPNFRSFSINFMHPYSCSTLSPPQSWQCHYFRDAPQGSLGTVGTPLIQNYFESNDSSWFEMDQFTWCKHSQKGICLK